MLKNAMAYCGMLQDGTIWYVCNGMLLVWYALVLYAMHALVWYAMAFHDVSWYP